MAHKMPPVMHQMLRRRLRSLERGAARPELQGRLRALADVLIPDGCAFKLANALSGIYSGTGQASELKLHAVYSVRANTAISVQTTAGNVHDSDGFWPKHWDEARCTAGISATTTTFGNEQTGLVSGGLVLEGTQIERLEHSVAHVRGDVTFRGNPALRYFELKQVDGDLTLDDNDALRDFVVRGDGHFGGDVHIVGNDRLEHASGLQWTRSVGGDLTIGDNASLVLPAMHDLDYVGGDVSISGNPALEHLDLATLRTIEGDLSVSGTAMTAWSGLDALEWIWGTARIVGNPDLDNIDLLALRHVGGLLAIRENSQLQRVGLDALSRADLGITDNPSLPACAVDALFERVTGSHRQGGNDERCP